MEPFAALKLEVNFWRWQGVPFYIPAGKCLPVTCTEIVCRLRKPPTFIPAAFLNSNYLRFRISPDVAIAMGMTGLAPGDRLVGQSTEIIASKQPEAQEMDAYERVLADHITEDSPLFQR